MPAKIQPDENLWFMYTCIKNSDMKIVSPVTLIEPSYSSHLHLLITTLPLIRNAKIDFAAVAAATKIKSPAARMRFTRLKRQIEDGTLLGRRGSAFSPTINKRRAKDMTGGKMVNNGVGGKQGSIGMQLGNEEDDMERDIVGVRKRVKVEANIKAEDEVGNAMEVIGIQPKKEEDSNSSLVDFKIISYISDDGLEDTSLFKLRKPDHSTAHAKHGSETSRAEGSLYDIPRFTEESNAQEKEYRHLEGLAQAYPNAYTDSIDQKPTRDLFEDSGPLLPFKQPKPEPVEHLDYFGRPWAPGAWGREDIGR